jgi:hypothetical protein
MLSLSTCQ